MSDWKPNKGPQTRFLSLTCDEVLYGGAAGGGKSESLLIDAIRLVGRGYGRAYSALLLRREFPELEKSLIFRSQELYPRLGGKYNDQKHVWKFPDGERVYFGHLQHEKDVKQYQSAEFQYIGFDELTQFTERQYVYLFSRCRSSKDVPLRMRGATNPGSEGHEWVFARWGYWLNPESKTRAESGQVLYLLRDDDGKEIVVPKGTPDAQSRTFVSSFIDNNPHIDARYRRKLKELDPVTRRQLEFGDWLIKPAKGLYFKRPWFKVVSARPTHPQTQWVRFWDRAATEGDGDWTVGLLLAKTPDGVLWICDVVRLQGNPGQVEATIRQTAQLDGINVMVGLSEDPGQAGKFESSYYSKALAGFNVRFLRESGSKIVRCQPASAQASVGNFRIVAGDWCREFLNELEAFPEGKWDDQVDSLSGAFNLLHEHALLSDEDAKLIVC